MATLAPSSCTARYPGANPADIAVCYALGQVGKPYLLGAAGPDRYDCSGLMQAAYQYAGVAISRVTYTQIHDGQAVGSIDQAKPGDLVFPYANLAHVVMYLGGGQIVEAPRTGLNVRVARYYGAAGGIRRIVAGGGAGVAAAGDLGAAEPTGVNSGSGFGSLASGVGVIVKAMQTPGDWASLGYIVGGLVLLGGAGLSLIGKVGL